jgi:hypothetical protein
MSTVVERSAEKLQAAMLARTEVPVFRGGTRAASAVTDWTAFCVTASVCSWICDLPMRIPRMPSAIAGSTRQMDDAPARDYSLQNVARFPRHYQFSILE